MSGDDALLRILDRDGLYWRYPDDDLDDSNKARWVELRIDAPVDSAPKAREAMESQGWTFASQPDEADDRVQRLYFRKFQQLDPEQRKAMLTAGYEAAVACSGRFSSWINLDDEHSN